MSDYFNSFKEYKDWLLQNKDFVTEYVKGNDFYLHTVELSVRTYNALRFNGCRKFSDIIFLSDEDILALDLTDVSVVREIRHIVNSFLNDNQSSIIGFVYSKTGALPKKEELPKKHEEAAEISKPAEAKVESEIGASDISIDTLGLSTRSANALKRNGIETISAFINADPRKIVLIRNIGQKSIDEIIAAQEKLKSSYESFVKEHSVKKEKTKEEKEAEYFSSLAQNKPQLTEVKIETLGLSVRSQNALLRYGVFTVFDLLRVNEAELRKIRNLGEKSIGEILKIRENILSGDMHEFEDDFDIASASVDEIFNHPKYGELVKDYFKKNDIAVAALSLSARSENALSNSGICSFSELLELYPYRISSVGNLGTKSVNEICHVVREYMNNNKKQIVAFCLGDTSLLYTEKYFEERLIKLFNGSGFKGFSFKEMKAVFPEDIDEQALKNAIGKLIAKREIEYVDFRCYRVYPSFYDVLNSEKEIISPDRREILLKRVEGQTLNEIGLELGVTRERIRQIFQKTADKFITSYKALTGMQYFDEDYYRYLYENYEVDREMWSDYINITPEALNYLDLFCKRGKKKVAYALNDENVDMSLRFKVFDYVNKDKIWLDGVLVTCSHTGVETFVLQNYVKEEMHYDDFVALCNEVLEKNYIPYSTKVYFDESIRRTRTNHLTDSKYCLWKQGERLRYYDIRNRDYSELLEVLNLDSYENTEVSTLKFFEDYPELMQKYNILDQYELHNLLKKIIRVEDYHDMSFGRQPMLKFGEFDRTEAILTILRIVAPVTVEELAEYVHMEYGYDKNTLMMTYFQPLSQYYSNGIYSIGFEQMLSEREKALREQLTEDFYYIDEIQRIYASLFDDAKVEEVNPYVLKGMGFRVYTNYVVKRPLNSEEYFTNILLENELYPLKPLLKKYSKVTFFYNVYKNLRRRFELFIFDDNEVITFKRLAKAGVQKRSIELFCDEVKNEVGDNEYFTIQSLKENGFESDLFNLGFSDSFYAGILASHNDFISQKVFGTIVLKKYSASNVPFSTRDFINDNLAEYDSVDIYEFIDDIKEKYGITITDKYDITGAVSGTSGYYDPIMEKIYKNKDLYYEDI